MEFHKHIRAIITVLYAIVMATGTLSRCQQVTITPAVLSSRVFHAPFVNANTSCNSKTKTKKYAASQHTHQINHILNLKHKKAYKKNSILSRTISRHLKAVRALLWGSKTWQHHYLRRLIALGTALSGLSLAKDIWTQQPANPVHVQSKNKNEQDIGTTIGTKTHNVQASLSLTPQLDSKKKCEPILERPISVVEEIPPAQHQEDEKTLASKDRITEVLEKYDKIRADLQEVVTSFDAECEQKVAASQNAVLEIQRKKNELGNRPTQFMEFMAISDHKNAITLLTKEEQDQEYVRTCHYFVQSLSQKFNTGEYQRLKQRDIKDEIYYFQGRIGDVIQDMRSQKHFIEINVCKIAIKVLSSMFDYTVPYLSTTEEQISWMTEALKYECQPLLLCLEEKYRSAYVIFQNTPEMQRFERLNHIKRRNEFNGENAIINWDQSVIEDDDEMMHYLLSKIKGFTWNHRYFLFIFGRENLYAMDLLLKKMKAIGQDINKPISGNRTLLDLYLAYTSYDVESYLVNIDYEQRSKIKALTCPLMTKLLINAGLRLGNMHLHESSIADNVIITNIHERTPLESFIFFTVNNPDSDGKRQKVVRLLLTERDKINLSDTAALCSAWTMGFTDLVQDIIFSSQECIHPRWISALFALSDSNIRKSIDRTVREREEVRPVQGHQRSTAATKEDNKILSTWLSIPTGIIDIMHEYLGILKDKKQRKPEDEEPDDNNDNDAAAVE